ncbi:4-hydroxyphenylacetate 3-hydroxylase N-terminal domain-containing protein [Streptomyces violascens]|uniref:4-hydroxyphenylacetate 3-hydroxylase N-terminal domain-containing protein n=1 Tax=Streptomyces violascens TaxID=67381 RepID=UPI003683B1D7
MSHAPTADHGAEAPNKLMTGDSFLESPRNGRQVFLDGELVEDATAHRVFANAAFVGQIHLGDLQKGKAEDMALAFIAPMNTPGMKAVCRTSHEKKAVSAFDNPLPSRFDENDAVLVFANAFIRWENVLIYRDTEKIHDYFPRSGLLSRGFFQGAVRMAVKLEFMVGILGKGTRMNGDRGAIAGSAAALIGFLLHVIGAAMVARVGLAGRTSALPVGVITSALGIAAVPSFTLIARPPTAPAQLAPVSTEAVR